MRNHDFRWASLAATLVTALSAWGFFFPGKGMSWSSPAADLRFDLLPGMFLALSDVDRFITSQTLQLAMGILLSLIWYFGLSYAFVKIFRLLVRAVAVRGDARWALACGVLLSLVATGNLFFEWPYLDFLSFPAAPAVQFARLFCFPVTMLAGLVTGFHETAEIGVTMFGVSLIWYFVISYWIIIVARLIGRVARSQYRNNS